MYSFSRGALEQNRPWWTDNYKSENSTLRLQLRRAAGTPCCLLRGCLQQAHAKWLGILVNDPREIKAASVCKPFTGIDCSCWECSWAAAALCLQLRLMPAIASRLAALTCLNAFYSTQCQV